MGDQTETAELGFSTEKVHTVLEVETIASGQPRAYADSICVQRLYGRWRNVYAGTAGPMPDERLLRCAEDLLVTRPREADVNKSDVDAYFGGWTEYVKIIEPGVAEVKTVTPYCD